MFSYYGSKSKIVKYYPSPEYNLIIEPFSGAAWYSFFYKEKKILLNDKYDVIYNIWNWLINKATSKLILKYKDFYERDDIRNLKIEKEHKQLIGFLCNRGSSSPGNLVQKWSCQSKFKPKYASTIESSLKRISENLKNIKHWEIQNKDYKKLPNIEATWFIDPPYIKGGEHYLINDIDYNELSEWCKSRKGQVIVCENNEAKWLDFKPLINTRGTRKYNNEVVWIKKSPKI